MVQSNAVKKFFWVKKFLDNSVKFNENIVSIILKYYWNLLSDKKKILKDWISIDDLDLETLNLNYNAIDFFIDNPDKICLNVICQNENPKILELLENINLPNNNEIWFSISKNPSLINIIERNLDKIDWYSLSENSNAIKLLEKNIDKIDWYQIALNPNAIDIIEQNLDKIDWSILSKNENAIDLLKSNPHKIDWQSISQNDNAISLLMENPINIDWEYLSLNSNALLLIDDKINEEQLLNNEQFQLLDEKNKIDDCYLCLNTNPRIIEILQKYPDKINWEMLSQNPAGINLLEKNKEKINYELLSLNPEIFTDEPIPDY